jgi:hypothetical protein
MVKEATQAHFAQQYIVVILICNTRQFTAEDLVFLDESIFKEKTGWHWISYHTYAPTGYHA